MCSDIPDALVSNPDTSLFINENALQDTNTCTNTNVEVPRIIEDIFSHDTSHDKTHDDQFSIFKCFRIILPRKWATVHSWLLFPILVFPPALSPMLTRPKDNPNRRIILNLSHPADNRHFSHKFIIVDDIVQEILKCYESLIFKIDVPRSFRSLRFDLMDILPKLWT